MRSYVQVSGALFGLTALAHLIRLVRRWPVLFHRYPGWGLVSLLFLAITCVMAVWAWRLLSRPVTA
jgi:hypothetical protein